MATWNIDAAHAKASFSVRHMMISTVRGHFEKVAGSIEFDPQNPTAGGSVEATIEAASIETGTADRDNHLRSADFLDAAQYPQIIFKSTRVEVDRSGENGKVYGDLTIRDVTRPVTLDVEYLGQITSPYGQQAVGFSASTRINREDWGLTWNVALETGGFLVGKDITVTLDLEGILVTEQEVAGQTA